MFDPYEQWLGITKAERPITCYRLLGVSPNEKNPEAIQQAADAQDFLISQYKNGPEGRYARRLLKEIEQVRNLLLDPAKRRAYDAKLRAGDKASAPIAEAVVDGAEVVETGAVGGAGGRVRAAGNGQRESEPFEEELRKKSAKPLALFLILGGVGVLLLLAAGGVAAVLFLGDYSPGQTDVAAAPKPAPITQPAVSPISAPAPAIKPEGPPVATPEKKEKEREPAKVEPAPVSPQPPAEKPPERPKPPPPAPKPPEPAKPAPKIVKVPVPNDAALAAAETALKETFKTDYARTRPEDRVALAGKFLQPGRENPKEPATWYVMLRESRDIAVQQNRPRLAVEAISEMDRWFIVNALELKLKALADISKSTNEFVVASTVRACLNLIQQAYSEPNYDAAKRFLAIANDAVKDGKSAKLIQLVRDEKADLDNFSAEFDAVTKARAKLATAPDDAQANFTVGQYLCFFQGDFDKGLPLLAKGSDGGLKRLAQQDLAQPAAVKEQLALADSWWNFAIIQKERQQKNTLRRAILWYERAGPNTNGADRTALIARIHEARQKEYARIARLFPGSFYGRDSENRALLLREGGGTMRSEEAIEKGLEWLAKHQSPSGMWSTDGFHRAAQCKCTEHGEKHDVAGTALGLLPFLGAGQTHKEGRYRTQVYRAIDYILKQQKPAGNFHDNAYENALATTAIVEVFGMTKDPGLRAPAAAATLFIIRAQDQGGSWGYSAGTKGDLSVSGWQFTALKAAAFAGFQVPAETFNRLSYFLETVADSGGLGYGYNSPGNGTSTSAAGILCREFLSWGPGHPGLEKEVNHLLRPDNVPTKDKISMYSVFYITQVAHHLGGYQWEKWNSSVRDLLIDLQDKGDDPKHVHQKGSWSARGDPYAKQGGRLMFTSLALITLECYYYHIPLYGYGSSVFD
jgi:hypothetical protein